MFSDCDEVSWAAKLKIPKKKKNTENYFLGEIHLLRPLSA